MLQVTINGQLHQFPAGISVLGAVREVGIDVPTVCHDDRLQPSAACRLCSVEIAGWNRLPTACNTPLANGMSIQTHSPGVEEVRRTLLQLLAENYPPSAVRDFPEKEFHRYLTQYGVTPATLSFVRRVEPDPSHPYIRVDMAQCITCFRCVRICNELQGQFVWKVWERGDATRIVPDSGTTLHESSCVACGACVDSCPSGALEDKSVLNLSGAEKWTRTTCPYCGVGCEMMVGTRGNRIVQIKPVLDAPVSKGHLCVKGRYALDIGYDNDRVMKPLIRKTGEWKMVPWPEAIAFVAENLNRIVKKHGPESVGVLGSARATNEDNYLAQKFARVVIGTNNVDCCARVCHAPSAAALKAMFGTGAATNSFDDIEQAQAFLLCGTNATENHPIVGARIKQTVLRGANLIVIDPRKIELAQYADIHLQIKPGTNVPLLNAMAYVIVEEQLFDPSALSERVSGWDEFRGFIRMFALDEGRTLFEDVWHAPVPDAKGLDLMEMMDAASNGKLKALWAIGYDIALTNPDANATAQSLNSLEFVIVQDMFLNRIAHEWGNVFFPVASSFEREGTFMNSERRIQRVRKVIQAPGEAKADWEIICELARAMGKGEFFDFHSPEQIWEEIRSVWKAGHGISYARLENGGLQWPCPTEDHPGTTVLHTKSFSRGARAPLKQIEFAASDETESPEYPFLLITGRTLYQFNAGTMTMRTPNVEF